MKITETPIEGLLEIQSDIFRDERGYFSVTWKEEFWKTLHPHISFVQDNLSYSRKNVLRGLHFQAPPFAQGKLVGVIRGKVLDVAVDIRKGSKTFGQHHKVILDSEKMNQFWISPGFAHGFLALEEHTIFTYKCSAPYNQSSEGSLLWNDPELNIDWGIEFPVVSDKDKSAMAFNQFKSPF